VPKHISSLLGSLEIPSPLQEVKFDGLSSRVFVKREDLIHPSISGNKWRKLQGYFTDFRDAGIVTLGGPFSNHLHATAAVCHFLDIPLVCLVRGEDADLENPTLYDLQAWGADIIRLNRTAFRAARSQNALPEDLRKVYADWCFIPEGGLDKPALPGIQQLALEIREQFESWPDVIVLPMGSGTTAFALRHFIPPTSRIVGVRAVADPALRERWATRFSELSSGRELEIVEGFEWGGFGRYDQKLLNWMNWVKVELGLEMDLVYNSKAFYALYQWIKEGKFSSSQTILYIHTGGLQGNRSLEYFAEKRC